MNCPNCSKPLEPAWKVCPHCGARVPEPPPTISVSDSVIKQINQVQNVDRREAQGASVGGSINIHVGSDARASAELQYEHYVTTIMQSGGSLDRARAKLEQRREQLGLTLKQAHETEAHCLAEIKVGSVSAAEPIELGGQQTGRVVPLSSDPTVANGASSQRRSPVPWLIGFGGVVVVGVVIAFVASNSGRQDAASSILPQQTTQSVSTSTPVSTTSPPASPTRFSIEVTVTPNGSGMVTPGGGSYANGERVTFVATPAAGFQFVSWSGSASGTNPSTGIIVDSGKSIVATFAAVRYTLTTSVYPIGAGTVSPSNMSIESGKTANLTATPAPGYRFAYWSGDVSSQSPEAMLRMTSDRTVTAFFRRQYDLSVTVTPAGTGSVSPASGVYDEGTQVTLTATPASGYQFASWAGDASGSSQTLLLTMGPSKSLVAKFGKAPYTGHITEWNIGVGTGEVTSIPYLNFGDRLSFSFIVTKGWSEVYYYVYDPSGNRVFTGAGGSKVMTGEGAITAATPGNYRIRFVSSGWFTSTKLNVSYTVTYAVP